jgi:phosphohistidine phosphatase
VNATPDLRRLWLVRHAEAQVEASVGGDHERALTRRGVAEANRAAERCLDLGWRPELLLASSALRTRQTAEILARSFGLSGGKLRILESLYLADPVDILRAASEAGPRIGHLMIIAHNPGISACAQQLAPSAALAEFDTAGVACFELALPDWSRLAPGSAASARYEAPR